MPDYQRVVESLRDLRQGPLQTVNEEITHLAAEYAALCVQANDRLRQCSAFLQQGLRTEAIHLADESPNLLDLVASLDLPDQQAWAEFCQNNGLAVPPALQLDRAAQINEAYAQDQPLEHLLSQHRLLALSRAPVRERLEVMRKIAQVEPANANWEKDIRLFERTRLRELPTAFYSAVKNHDDQAIAGIMEEVTRHAWYEPVPTELAAAVSDAYGRVRRAGVEIELRKMVEPLRDAFAARSLQECQALVQRWKNTMAAGSVVQIAPDLMDEIRPVVAFVNEQTRRDEYIKRFREMCRAFTQMLDKDAPDAQLEAGYSKLREFKEEIPEDITRRYMNKRSGRRRSTERSHKTRLTMIAAVAGAAIVIGLVIALLFSRSTAAQQWADKIHAAVKLHSQTGLSEAQHYVEDLQKNNPGLLKEPVVSSALSDLETQQAEFTRDGDALRTLLRKAEDAKLVSAPTVANPAASLAAIGTSATALQTVAGEARAAAGDLEWVDPENKLPAAMAGVNANIASLRDRMGSLARKELESISTQLDVIPANITTPDGAAAARGQIAALSDRVNTLRGLPLIDSDTQTAISQLAQKIVQRRQGADTLRTVAEELQNIRGHADSAGDLQAGLDAFTKRFPDDPHTRDFATALKRMPLASALEAWQALVATFNNSFAAGTQQAAQKRLDAVNAYLAAHPDSPMGTAISQYADHLHQAIEALDAKGTWQNAFADLLATPLLSDLAIMEVSDGRKYYVLGDVKRVERKINGQVSVSFDSLNLKDLTKRINITVDPPLSVSESPIPAPHTKTIAEIADDLKVINETNWDTYGIDLVDRLLRNDRMDLIVKAMLILPALKTEETLAGWALGDSYSKVIAELSRQAPDQLPWLEPPKITDGTRRAIQQAVTAIPAGAAMKQKLAATKTAFFKSLAFDTSGIGVLMKDDQGAWRVFSNSTPMGGSMVWTVLPPVASSAPPPAPAPSPFAPATSTAPATEEAPATVTAPPAVPLNPGSMLLVGTAAGGRFVLDDSVLRTVPEGSIIYITRP